MKRILVTALVIMTIVCLAGNAMAEQLTLDDCIELALKNRASIIRARGAEVSAAAWQRSALGAFMPQIRGSYSYTRGKQTKINPGFGADNEITEQEYGPSKTFGISASWTILDFSNVFDVAAARASHARSELNVIASEQDLIYSVKVSFYAYLASEENVETQREAVKRAKEQLKLIESKFELGSAAKSDVLKQKVQFGNDRLALLRAENAVINAVAMLAYTVGLDPREDHHFSANYHAREYEGSLDEAINFGISHNPSLLAQQKSIEWSSRSLKSSKATYLPSLTLNGSWVKFNGTERFPEVTNYSYQNRSWGFSIGLNIFDGFFREKRVTDARVNLNNSRADFSDLRNKTVSDIKTGFNEIDQFKQQKSVSQENVAAADEDLKITQEKYNLGAATILDLLDAQVSLKRAQVSLISVDFDLNLAIARLEKSMGKM